MNRWFKEKKAWSAIGAGLLCSGMLATGVASFGAGAGAASVRHKASPHAASSVVLTMESTPENSITQSFNPFSTTSSGEQMGATSLVYEPLYQFDLANPTISYPWLATSYKWSNGGKTITFTIRKGVKWSNGSALTPADVAFTYNLVKKYTDINTGGLTISSVKTSGDDVTINFPTAQYTNLQQIANVYIVPKAIWSTVGDPGKYVDANPIGTGPYVLGSFTPQGFTMTKNKSYWQAGKPKIQSVYFPAYASNTNALTALTSGQAQWEGNFIPGLDKIFVKTNPAAHHYWMAAGNTVAIEPNLTQWPTNVLAVRQAISLAVNRTTIGAEGEDGLEQATTNASGLTLPTFKAWLASSVKSDSLNVTPEVAKAKATLKAAGFVMGKSGYFQTKSGKTLAVTIKDPASYTDYAADAGIIAQDLQNAGIKATFDAQAVTAWDDDVASGNFSLVVHWSNGGITPYSLYNGWLNSALATKSASGDYEHLSDPALNKDLTKLASATTVAQQTADLAPLESYVAKQLPVIPVVYGASWDEYNSQHISGWPTAANPYESGQPSAPTNEVVILHLTPKG